MNKIITTLITISCLTIVSCSQDITTTNETEINSNKKVESPQANSPSIYSIKGESIPIRKKPDEKAAKVINETATKVIGETQYCEVGYTTKVIILEKNNTWSKIKVVEPEWLSDTYIGWIPSKFILINGEQESAAIENIKTSDYEILKTRYNSAVENYHVLLKRKDFDKEYIYQFIKQFRKENCKANCNISLYDTKSITNLIGVYPLPDKDYKKMADHLISISTFDAPELRDWYPYQDFHYKELGGKNWKKEPIK